MKRTHSSPSVHTGKSATAPLGALAAGLGFVSLSIAQEGPVAESKALPPITVKGAPDQAGKESYQAIQTRIGKADQDLRDVPQSITVVTEKLIEDRRIDTLKEALRNTAGISFLAAEGGEEDIRLRGFSLQATGDIFIDGMRDPAFYERDTFNWDRLEVLRGSASMLFGRGSTGGAVNQVTKLPRLATGYDVEVTAGNGEYYRAVVDANLRTGETSALHVAAMGTSADNYGVGLDKRGVAPTFRWGAGSANEFVAGLYYLKNDNGISYGLPWLVTTNSGDPLLPVDSSSYYGMSSDYNRSGVTYGQLAHTFHFANDATWRTAVRVGQYERDQRASAVRFAAAALQPDGLAVTRDRLSDATVLTRGTNIKNMDMDTVYVQSDLDHEFDAFGLTHSMQGGIDAAREEFDGFVGLLPGGVVLAKATTTIGTPDNGVGVDESLRIKTRNRDFEARAAGVYVQDLVQVAPDWKVLGGVRWDRFEGNYRTFSTTTADFGALTAERGRADSLWSKRLGVLYQPSPMASFHFSYGTSFNTSGDTYQYDALGSNTPPEASRNLELGGRLDLAEGNASVRLALFHATKYNERNRDEDSVSPTNYVLSGERHAAGVEVDVSGRITPAWEVYVSYAWIPDAEVDKASSVLGTTLIGETVGQRPGLTPRYTGTVWSTYTVTPELRLGAGINARSNDTPQQSTIVAPAFITGDLMAEYEFRSMSLKLNVTNLTDERYADVLYRGHYVPGKARTVQLTAGFSF
ncbi:MAG: TonB-dependent receptor [Steroidobacteraceae bacterium]